MIKTELLSQYLTLTNDSEVKGHASIGSAASPNKSSIFYPSSTFEALLLMEESITSTAVTQVSGFVNYLEYNPGADATAVALYLSDNEITIPASNSQNIGYINGIYSAVDHFGSGPANQVAGIYGATYNQGPALVADGTGVYSDVGISSTGNMTTAHALYCRVLNEGGGGTIATGYGLYIDSINATTSYGVYQSDIANPNYFAGNIGVGISPNVASKVSASISGTDTNAGISAGIFNATSNTTVNGSNTTIGINGAVTGLVQVGAENDKLIGGMNFSVTRGDGTDQGLLDVMVGANALLFHNSDTAGVTSKAYGFSNTFFSLDGTLTSLYDFYSVRIPAGPGVVTNHYGVYLENDSTTPIKNWLSGASQFGGTSFTAPSSVIEAYGPIGFVDSGFQVSFVAPTLAASTAYTLPATDGTSGYVLSTDGAGLLSWVSASGGGANTALSNLASTAVNAPLNDSAGLASLDLTTRTLTDSTNNLSVSYEVRQLFDGAALESVDYANRLLTYSSGQASVDWANSSLFDTTNIQALNYQIRVLSANDGSTSVDWSAPSSLLTSCNIEPSIDQTFKIGDTGTQFAEVWANVFQSAVTVDLVSNGGDLTLTASGGGNLNANVDTAIALNTSGGNITLNPSTKIVDVSASVITNPSGGSATFPTLTTSSTFTDTRVTTSCIVIPVFQATPGQSLRAVTSNSGSFTIVLSGPSVGAQAFKYVIMDNPS